MKPLAKHSLLSFLAEVPDPRSRFGRQHPLPAVLALVCCAILCGGEGSRRSPNGLTTRTSR